MLWVLFALIAVDWLYKHVETLQSFEHFLIVLFICEAIAVPVNPIPRWALEHEYEAQESIIARGISKVFGRKKKE